MKGEDPWRTLGQHPELVLEWGELDPSTGGARWDGLTITLDERLGRIERDCALLHEIVHYERGVGWPHATAATMQREEAIVRRITAVRLVPLDQLAVLVAGRIDVEPVTTRLVAREFDVTEAVAWVALDVLRQRVLERERALAGRLTTTAP